jgi:hypothetical protein
MKRLSDFAYQWNELAFVEIVPVVEDAGLMSVLAKLKESKG